MSKRKFQSAAERISIYNEDFDAVCAVLAGPSRWKQYIGPNIPIALKAAPARHFNIVSASDFSRFNLGPDTGGLTNKITGEITMKELFKDSRETLMISALHEMVHLVSHPPEQGKKVTAFGFLGEGLLEGLTHCVTEDIIADQGLSPSWLATYTDRVKIVRKLIETFGTSSISMFGKALFQGHMSDMNSMLAVFGGRGMQEIRQLATMNNSTKAIACIDRLVKAQSVKKTSAPAAAAARH